MGDSSPCIARTFSQPISYADQDDHCYRALTSSFSFGRYESDLDWGKWSCFTQNRCLEEVQKLSKPGTVAAMKAYFEARYKRVANKKSAKLLSNQQNEVPRDSHNPGFMKIHNKSQRVSDSTIFKANDTGNALKEGEGNTKLYDSSKQHGNRQKHNSIRFTKEARTLSKNNAAMEDLTPPSTRKPAISSLNVQTCGIASMARAPVTPRKENNSTPNSNKAARDSIVKRQSPLKSLHKPSNFASCASESKKTSSPVLDSIRNLRIIKSFGKSSKGSTTQPAPTREGLHGVETCNSEPPHQENISVGRKKPSSTVFSSFGFQREERGARHEEKLEKKINRKGTEITQLQTKFKSHSSELGRKPPNRQGQDSASSRPRPESSGKKQLKACYRKE